MKKFIQIATVASLFSLIACAGNDKSELSDKNNSKDEIDSTEISAEESNEKDSPKKKLLISMIGKHKLNSISGLVGMNGMFDFFVEDGIWKGQGSANEGGQREGYDLEIADTELKKLNSICIVVSDDLTVTLESNGKTLCKIPYSEKLKELKIDAASAHLEFDEVISKITEDNNLVNGWYYLLMRDDISEDKMKEIDIPQSFTPDFISIILSEDLKEFNVEIKANVCCDQATYVFKK
jgi:hypothetical protein